MRTRGCRGPSREADSGGRPASAGDPDLRRATRSGQLEAGRNQCIDGLQAERAASPV